LIWIIFEFGLKKENRKGFENGKSFPLLIWPDGPAPSSTSTSPRPSGPALPSVLQPNPTLAEAVVGPDPPHYE